MRLSRRRPRELVGVIGGVSALPFDVPGVAGGMMPPTLLVERTVEDLGVVGDGVTLSRLLPNL